MDQSLDLSSAVPKTLDLDARPLDNIHQYRRLLAADHLGDLGDTVPPPAGHPEGEHLCPAVRFLLEFGDLPLAGHHLSEPCSCRLPPLKGSGRSNGYHTFNNSETASGALLLGSATP